MQIQIFTLPMLSSEADLETFNKFLKSKKILQVEKSFVSHDGQGFWSFCVTYLESDSATAEASKPQKPRVDYKEILDESTFERFSKMRAIRKELANKESMPAYGIFLDEELVAIAKLEDPTLASLKTIKGIGAKKVEKYGVAILSAFQTTQDSPDKSPN